MLDKELSTSSTRLRKTDRRESHVQSGQSNRASFLGWAVDWGVRDFHGCLTRRGTTHNAFLITAKR